MRLGVLGGTFDPIHYGHLAIAQEAAEALALPLVLFVPAALPPHKQEQQITAPEHRLRMVTAAIADNSRFSLSTIEFERAGPSYTVDTLREVRRRYAGLTELYYIVGGDAPADLARWHQPEELFRMATLVVVSRPGYGEEGIESITAAIAGAKGRIVRLEGPGYDLAATKIRTLIAAGRSARYLVPPAVAAYIAGHGLYRQPAPGKPNG